MNRIRNVTKTREYSQEMLVYAPRDSFQSLIQFKVCSLRMRRNGKLNNILRLYETSQVMMSRTLLKYDTVNMNTIKTKWVQWFWYESHIDWLLCEEFGSVCWHKHHYYTLWYNFLAKRSSKINLKCLKIK